MSKSKKIIYLELIRVVAVYLVIFTHTGDLGSKLYQYGEYSILRDIVYMAMDVLRRINVPLFFMVSGALMLGKEENYRDFFSKRVVKYVLVTICMSVVYYFFYFKKEFDVFSFFKAVYQGNVIGLFWFLYAYMGYILILPFLRKMVIGMDMTEYKYLLILGIAFKTIIPMMNEMLGLGYIGITSYFTLDIIFFPILGYYFANIWGDEKFCATHLIRGAIVSILCIMFVVALTYWEGRGGTYTEKYYGMFNIVPTCYFFCLIRKIGMKLEKHSIIANIILWLGNCSFGVYLLSIYIQVKMMWVYRELYKLFPQFPLGCCLVYVGIVMCVAAIVVAVLKKIPGIKKLF